MRARRLSLESCSMKRQGVFPLDGMVDQNGRRTYLYTWVERGIVNGKRLPRVLNTVSPEGDSHMEQTGMLIGNFEFNPKRRPSGRGSSFL